MENLIRFQRINNEMAGYKDIQPRWKKGESGNPKGRPKLPNLKDVISAVLGDEKDGKSAAEAILMALRNKAIKGDVRAAELLLDRAYGKAKQDVDVEMRMQEVLMPKPPSEAINES
jgi:hypothetical protein